MAKRYSLTLPDLSSTMSKLITDVGLSPLTLSLAGSSFLFFGMTQLEVSGPINLIRDKADPLNLNKRDKVRIWAAFFHRTAVSM
jgi:hypothetical protein